MCQRYAENLEGGRGMHEKKEVKRNTCIPLFEE